jgi:hypothetical protein
VAIGCGVVVLSWLPAESNAQRVQLRDFFGGAAPGQQLPTPPMTLPQFPSAQPQPVFDGFAAGNIELPPLSLPPLSLPAAGQNPSLAPSPSFPIFPRANPFPNPSQPIPNGGFAPQGQIIGASPFQPPGQVFGQPIPNRWPYEGTGSNWLPPADWTWPQQAWSSFRDQFLPRVLERPRARQTWITGNSDNPLELNELELATTMTLPNFLGSTQPLRVSPGFIFHWIDGPDSTVNPNFDLPARLYSSYLSFDHMTNPNNRFGLENNLTIGFYSDFEDYSSDGLRLTGKLVGWNRINDYTVGKLGVEYLDRVDVKLLPAFGVYMAPNPNIRWDLYFPRTKLAHRLPNVGNFEVWSYVGAEYGGGSWVMDRRDGSSDQADINDVRSFLGFEWMGPRRVTGFFEVGYVFQREIVYRSDPNNPLKVEDAFMLRSGLAF